METDDSFERSLFALTVLGFGLILAGAEPVEPILWALFGIATAARVAGDKRNAGAVAAPMISGQFCGASTDLTFARVPSE